MLQAAAAPEPGGEPVLYMHDMRSMEPAAAARDERLAEQLWAYSSQQVGLSPEEDQRTCWPTI